MKVFLKSTVATVSVIGASFMSYGLWLVHKDEGIRNVFMEGFNEGMEKLK